MALTAEQKELAGDYLARIIKNRQVENEQRAYLYQDDSYRHYTIGVAWKEVSNILHEKINYDCAFKIMDEAKIALPEYSIIINYGLKRWEAKKL